MEFRRVRVPFDLRLGNNEFSGPDPSHSAACMPRICAETSVQRRRAVAAGTLGRSGEEE